MKRILLKCCLLFLTISVFAQSKPLYKLPETLPDKSGSENQVPFLIGCDNGLYRIISDGTSLPLWTEDKVSQIVRCDVTNENGVRSAKWYFVTGKGIYTSSDLKTFTDCNNGLPHLTIKEFDGVNKSFVNKTSLLKDLCADPFDQNILVTATKEEVFLTRDGGATWKSDRKSVV